MARSLPARAPAQELISAAEFCEQLKPAKKRGRFPVSPVETRTVDGVVFASKREAFRFLVLRTRQRIGEICELECQPKFTIQINGQPYCTYRADFRYRLVASGEFIIEDVKGRGKGGTAGDAAYRLRKKAAELFCSIQVTEVA